MRRIGVITIGQSPRDDIVPEMRRHWPPGVEILQRGALDDLDLTGVARLRPKAGQPTLVTRMRDGTEVMVTHEKVFPLMQEGVDDLVQEGVEFIVSLCSGEFPDFRADRMILHPDRLLHGVVAALAKGVRLGVVLPSTSQVPQAEKGRSAKWDASDVVITAASPYAAPEIRSEEWHRAAEELKRSKVDLIFLDCMGIDEEMRGIVQRVTRKPVLLVRSVVARIVGELLGPGNENDVQKIVEQM